MSVAAAVGSLARLRQRTATASRGAQASRTMTASARLSRVKPAAKREKVVSPENKLKGDSATVLNALSLGMKSDVAQKSPIATPKMAASPPAMRARVGRSPSDPTITIR
jgi:hypothetical protein